MHSDFSQKCTAVIGKVRPCSTVIVQQHCLRFLWKRRQLYTWKPSQPHGVLEGCSEAVQHWTMETWKSRRSNALQGTHSVCLRVLHLELFQVHYECHSTPSPQRVPHRAPQATFQALQQVIPLQRIQLLQRVQPLQRSRPGSKSDLRSGWKPCGRCDLCSGSSLSVLLGRYTHTI